MNDDLQYIRLFAEAYEEYLIEKSEKTHSEHLDDELDKMNDIE